MSSWSGASGASVRGFYVVIRGVVLVERMWRGNWSEAMVRAWAVGFSRMVWPVLLPVR